MALAVITGVPLVSVRRPPAARMTSLLLATVSVIAGKVRVKLLAPAFALAKVVAPVDEPSSKISEFVKVCAAVHVLALPRLSAASTAPVVGDIVSVPAPESVTLDTAAAPEHEPHVGVARLPESKHCPAVPVPARIFNFEASDQTMPPALAVSALFVPPWLRAIFVPAQTPVPIVPTVVKDDVTMPAGSVVPVRPLAGAAAAVMEELHPKPVLVVQFSAEPADEHPETLCAVGEAEPDVALTRTVFVPCVARSARVINPVAVTAVVKVGESTVGDAARTTLFPTMPVVAIFPKVPPLL